MGGSKPRSTTEPEVPPSSVAVADFDGDGRPDLAVANLTSDSVAVLTNISCPLLRLDDAAMREGDSGPTEMVFTATLSPAVSYQVTVDFATSPGTAIADVDYMSIAGM